MEKSAEGDEISSEKATTFVIGTSARWVGTSSPSSHSWLCSSMVLRSFHYDHPSLSSGCFSSSSSLVSCERASGALECLRSRYVTLLLVFWRQCCTELKVVHGSWCLSHNLLGFIGSGFSGVWFHLGFLQSLPTLHEHYYYCYSSGCLSTLYLRATGRNLCTYQLNLTCHVLFCTVQAS